VQNNHKKQQQERQKINSIIIKEVA